METLPLFHRLAGTPVLVTGEGEMAEAKARLVREAGGAVVGAMQPGVRLAFVSGETAAEQATALRAQGVLVNVPDRPDLSDFLVPAIVDRGAVTVAVGSSGTSAALSKALKERLEWVLPAHLGALATAIRAARDAVVERLPALESRREFWAAALAPGGRLDPLAPHDNPAATIADALRGSDYPTATLHAIIVGPGGAEALTLADLRRLSQADLVVHPADLPAAVLALIRRDASRHVGDAAPAGTQGRIVVLRHQP